MADIVSTPLHGLDLQKAIVVDFSEAQSIKRLIFLCIFGNSRTRCRKTSTDTARRQALLLRAHPLNFMLPGLKIARQMRAIPILHWGPKPHREPLGVPARHKPPPHAA